MEEEEGGERDRPAAMEETWQAKCRSEWQPANQMDMNSRRNFPPFTMQGTNPKDHPTVQEQLVFHTFNLDLAQSGKTELSNSFVALLSGHPRLSADISQLPNSTPGLPKLPIHSGGANFGVPATSIPSLSENHGDDSTHNKQTSSFVESRQSLLPNSTKSPHFRNSRQIATSHFHGIRASKPASDQSFQASNRGMVVSPNWTVGASPGDPSQQHTLNIQTAQKTRIEAGPFASGHNSADFRGRPRVFCMNTAGLLFLSDMGLLGVICFCHNLQMSVAKFCEHSGSSSVNPGEAVRLENGMTIAQWCRLCFGNNPPDDGKGWDWLDIPRAKGRLAGSQDNNFPSLSKIPRTIDFGGSARSGDFWNKSTHNNLKNWTNKGPGNMHHRNGLEGYNHFLNNFPNASQSPMPALVNSHTVQAGKQSPSCLGSEAPRSFFDNREKNVWPCLIDNRDNFKGRFGNASIPLTYSNIKENLSHEHNVGRGKEYAMVGDGNSSNVDLRLGQPSQHTHAYAATFPTTMNPLQFGEVRITRKAPINLPPTEITGHVKLTKKSRQSLQYSPVEASSSSIRELAGGSSNAFSETECEQLIGNSTKNPQTSLFLSHLSTEGDNLSQSTPIVNNNRYVMARPLDLQSVSSYLPENISERNDRHERKYSTDGFGLSNNIDKVKGPEIVDTKSRNIVKGSYMVPSKQRSDTTVVRTANGAHHFHDNFSGGDSQPSWHISHESSILQKGPDAMNNNKYGEVPFLGNTDNHNHTVCGFSNVASHATARPDLSSSGTPTTLTSPKAMDTSQPTFPLPNKRSIDCSQHLRDENMRLVALKHSVELCKTKQEQSGATCRTSTGHQRLCCHSTMQLQRVLCKDMLGSLEEFRHGNCSHVQQDASQFAIRPPYSYLNCYSAGGAEMLASKPGARGNECCSCMAVTPRISQCSTCHVCGAAEHPCLRLEGNPNISCEGFKQMYDQKEKTSSISRNCCCTVPSKNLIGCCFLGGDKPSVSTNEQNVPGKARIVHINPACDKDHMFQCGENIRLSRCEFSRENILIMNDCKTGHWRDVPTKSMGQSDDNLADRPARMLKSSSVARNQCPGTALKESDGPHQMSESRKEQQMSNHCSGTSALALTEFSAEVNTDFHAINIDDAKNAYNPLVDEASGIEKCGSSDEALGSGVCEVLTVSSKVFSNQSDCSPCHSSGNLNNELRLESPSNKRRVRRNEGFTGGGAQENIKKMMPIERVWKVDKLNVSVPNTDIYPINEMSPHCKSDSSWNFCSPRKSEATQSDNVNQNMCDFPIRSLTVKRKRSALAASRPLPLSGENHGNLLESDKIRIEGVDQSLKVSAKKEAKPVHLEKDITEQKGSHLTAGKPPKYMSLNCIRDCKGSETGSANTKARPVVCGKSGTISNGQLHGRQKPAKIVSLSVILKKSKRCDMNDSGVKPRPLLTSKNKEIHDADVRCCNQLTSWKLQHNNELSSKVKINRSTLTTVLMSDKNVGYSNNSDRCLDDYPMTESETGDVSHKVEKPSLDHKKPNSKTKSRHREDRRSSLSKLLGISEYATAHLYAPNLGENHISNSGGAENKPMALPSTTAGIECQPESSIQKCSLSNSISLEEYSQNNEDHAGAHCRTTTKRSSEVHTCQPFLLNSAAFCCVCGCLNKEANNFLLECKRCFIRVHQACYGVSKVPKGDWFCRPCKTDSQNTACVLCGYGGGAMTRAVKSQIIVRSLLKAWHVGTRSSILELVPPLKSDQNKFLQPISFGEASKFGNTDSISVVTSTSYEAFPQAAFDTSPNQTSIVGYSGSPPQKIELCNSITAGALDSSVTQWVHVVCGLWTPGTRCPNVDTMGCFDVSGASAARKNIVCSVCNRPGGSCIRCRVLNCYVHFHPWCAHQKGLLQSETEGDDNEKVGFYGRCTLHSTQNGFHVGPVDAEIESPRKDWTCARTEGFKGRKSEQGSKQYHRMPYKDNGGCIVSQEQINAWLHINGQKSCARPVVKLQCSDVEHDFRKEYFRYKQLKAWKHLVVYKSGIHALGLYTSQLIARGAMVVEYVGEIVGLRIADKRELEYQSGKRLQYKSACYFFRIDKEHIIDATRKGGIARFVNHSCLPNCVAKIISVRNEKKVVFFAERDINPGEEITYDYHFNREDEGQKIPCFCNSKNCRQYLN